MYDTNQKSKERLESIDRVGFKKAEKKAGSSNNVPADWATYKAPLQNFTIRHPKDWKISSESNRVADSSPDEQASITSPGGIKIHYVELEAGLNGDGEEFVEVGGCGTQSSCLTEYVNSIEKIELAGKGEVQLIKAGTNKTEVDGIYVQQPGYAMHLHTPSSSKSTFKLGANKLGSGKDGYTIFYKIKGKPTFWIGLHAYFPESYNSMTAEEVFGSEEAKTAEKILRSLSFQ